MTRTLDALVAARCGASFVGMVLHADSPRTISPMRAREIIEALPASVTPVGLFVNAPLNEVLATAGELRLSHVQLHGEESLDYVAALRGLHVWKMLRVDQRLSFRFQDWRAAGIEAVVLETANTGLPGGSGRENDWNAIQVLREQIGDETSPRLIAAGGLTPQNVAEVVKLIRPWAVDVSSGVEDSVKGIKSESKIRQFLEAASRA